MPRGSAVHKTLHMTCKQCGKQITGRPHEMARHARLECPARTSERPPAPPTYTSPFDHLVEFVDKLDASQLHAEIDSLNRRKAALEILLDAAKARHKPAGG